jgi:SNF2 family DNA or RNA helicase
MAFWAARQTPPAPANSTQALLTVLRETPQQQQQQRQFHAARPRRPPPRQWLDALQRQHSDAQRAQPAAVAVSPLQPSDYGETLTPRLRSVRFADSPVLQSEFLRARPRTTLFRHQEEGVVFMMAREAAGAGGIIGDEMRLGKTLMVFALVLRDLQRRVAAGEDRFGRPTLFIMPKSLLATCRAELLKHFASTEHPLHCATVGEGQHRAASPQTLMRDIDLVLTTYPTLQSAKYAKALFEVPWRRIVADEAHLFASGARRHGSQMLRLMRALRADYRWFMSGTPVQNHSSDLGTALQFIGVPAAVAFATPTSPAFRQCVERVLLRRRWADVSVDGAAPSGPAGGVMRTVEMAFDTPAEEQLYASYLARARSAVAQHRRADQERYAVRLVTQLRQLCLCPLLVRDLAVPPDVRRGATDVDAVDAVMTRLWYHRALYGVDGVDGTRASCANLPALAGTALAAAEGYFRGLLPPIFTKERAVLDYVRTLPPGEKVVVYSHYMSVLARVAALLEERRPGCARFVHGQVLRSEDRTRLLSEFEHDAQVSCLLITKGTGSLGLSLTCARHVILMEQWWNPTVDAQAVARLFDSRQRAIVVTVLAIRHTIDTYVAEVANRKRALDELLPVDRVIHLHQREVAEPLDYSHALRFLFGAADTAR